MRRKGRFLDLWDWIYEREQLEEHEGSFKKKKDEEHSWELRLRLSSSLMFLYVTIVLDVTHHVPIPAVLCCFFCLFFQLLLWKYQDKWVIWPDYCWKTSRQICQSSLTADGKNQSEWKGGDWDNEYYIETNSVKQTTSRQQQNIGEWEWSDLRLFWHAFSRHSKQPEAS